MDDYLVKCSTAEYFGGPETFDRYISQQEAQERYNKPTDYSKIGLVYKGDQAVQYDFEEEK